MIIVKKCTTVNLGNPGSIWPTILSGLGEDPD